MEGPGSDTELTRIIESKIEVQLRKEQPSLAQEVIQEVKQQVAPYVVDRVTRDVVEQVRTWLEHLNNQSPQK